MSVSCMHTTQSPFKGAVIPFYFRFIFVLLFVSFMLFSAFAATPYDYAIDGFKNSQAENGSMKNSSVATAYALLVFSDVGYSKGTVWTVKSDAGTFQGGVQKMIDWALDSQTPNGSWANNPRTTSMIVKGLDSFGVKGQPIEDAVAYLKKQDYSKALMNDAYGIEYVCVDEICNKAFAAMALEAAGDPGAEVLFSELEAMQFKHDSPDSVFDDEGGWSRTPDLLSKANLTSTLSVLYALTHTSASFDREAAKSFILSNQSFDGGWSPNLTGMTIEETAFAVFDLSRLGSGISSPELTQNMNCISGISDSVQSFDNVLFYSVAYSGYVKALNPQQPEPKNDSPVPVFSVPGSVVAGKQASFDASGSSDDGEIVKYTFDFGDGKSASGKIVQHTFLKDGVFSVKLTVVDNLGAESSVTKEVNVNKKDSILMAEKLLEDQAKEDKNISGVFDGFVGSGDAGSSFNMVLFAVLIIVLITVAIVVVRRTDLI